MSDVMEFISKVMALTSTVAALQSSVDNLTSKVENHTEKIIKLENREELLEERMTRKAVEAVFNMSNTLHERIGKVERDINSKSPSIKQIQE